jgi:hypothetical protein
LTAARANAEAKDRADAMAESMKLISSILDPVPARK